MSAPIGDGFTLSGAVGRRVSDMSRLADARALQPQSARSVLEGWYLNVFPTGAE